MPSTGSTCNVLVTSIGDARPRIAVAVAHGLDIPIDKALQAIYQAPSVLVSDIETPLADRLSAMLDKVGLKTEVTSGKAELPAKTLFDVALHIRRPERAYEIAESIADFCACDTARALTLITTPPGVVLGGISASTVEALERLLPAGAAEIIASDPAAARYVLIYAGESATVRAQLQDLLAARGLTGGAAGDMLAGDLGFADAQHIWGSFGRTGSVRIVNRDFLRFEIWLDGPLDSVGTDATRKAALVTLAGAPAEEAGAILTHVPFVLEDGIRHAALEARMRLYAEAGLKVRAELTTFQSIALEVVGADDPQQLAGAARGLGIADNVVPPFVTGAMPEAHARIARAVLEAAGAEVYFAGAGHG